VLLRYVSTLALLLPQINPLSTSRILAVGRKFRLLQICARTSMLTLQAFNFGKSTPPVAGFPPRLASAYPIKVPRAFPRCRPGLVKPAPRVSVDLRPEEHLFMIPFARQAGRPGARLGKFFVCVGHATRPTRFAC
jgi:hypothetical protein